MPLPFVKMHGLGNDYVYVDGFTYDVQNPEALAMKMADRHFGVGSDGLILVLAPEPGVDAHCRMRMFNADGSEGEMCGNGIRCVCKFAHDHELFPGARSATPMLVQTRNGVLTLDYQVGDDDTVSTVTVDMGEPRLEPGEVPIDTAHADATDQPQTFVVTLDGQSMEATCVSTGNPHAVIYVDDLEPVRAELDRVGPKLEHHPAFPQRANIHFACVLGQDEAEVVHWERGSGATLACGTGASAVCVAGVLTGRTQRDLTTYLPGGPLQLRWDGKTNHVFMTGPATEVYQGVWPD